MSISDLSFIFYYLPAFYAVYYVCPARARRFVLALGGLLFYAWGRIGDAVFLLALSLVVWALTLAAAGKGSVTGDRKAGGPEAGDGESSPPRSLRRKLFCWIGIAICVAFLAAFKYLDTPLGFPLGASFYIFHMISCLADVMGGTEPEKDPSYFLAYVAMFPKLIMGPIVRYRDLVGELRAPAPTLTDVSDGLFRFVVGLSKKALLAMQLAPITESLWVDAPYSRPAAWLGAVCWSMQLYFDFSSYSDMAIGLGRMAGLSFGENFDYPYTSFSVTEFYRRWHISLGRWFRDYVYIPLGGSRRGTGRVLLNLMFVWLLTGMWHGSTLNFLVWGLGLGAVICVEKLAGIPKQKKNPVFWLWTTLWIVVSWVVFNSADLPSALAYVKAMFGGSPYVVSQSVKTAFHDTWYVLLGAAVACTPLVRNVCRKLSGDTEGLRANILKGAALCVLMGLSLLVIVNSGYSAFIYTKF